MTKIPPRPWRVVRGNYPGDRSLYVVGSDGYGVVALMDGEDAEGERTAEFIVRLVNAEPDICAVNIEGPDATGPCGKCLACWRSRAECAEALPDHELTRIIRATVPEPHKHAPSAAAAMQSYIGELEQKADSAADPDVVAALERARACIACTMMSRELLPIIDAALAKVRP